MADLAPLSVLKNLEVGTPSRLPLPRRRFSFVLRNHADHQSPVTTFRFVIPRALARASATQFQYSFGRSMAGTSVKICLQGRVLRPTVCYSLVPLLANSNCYVPIRGIRLPSSYCG